MRLLVGLKFYVLGFMAAVLFGCASPCPAAMAEISLENDVADVRYEMLEQDLFRLETIRFFKWESVGFNVVADERGVPLDLSGTNVVIRWECYAETGSTNAAIYKLGGVVDASAGSVRVELTPAEAGLPAGEYYSYLRALEVADGTNTSTVVLAYNRLVVEWAPNPGEYTYAGPYTSDQLDGYATIADLATVSNLAANAESPNYAAVSNAAMSAVQQGGAATNILPVFVDSPASVSVSGAGSGDCNGGYSFWQVTGGFNAYTNASGMYLSRVADVVWMICPNPPPSETGLEYYTYTDGVGLFPPTGATWSSYDGANDPAPSVVVNPATDFQGDWVDALGLADVAGSVAEVSNRVDGLDVRSNAWNTAADTVVESSNVWNTAASAVQQDGSTFYDFPLEITVGGAGISDANGTYVYESIFLGYPKYRNANNYTARFGSVKWEITNNDASIKYWNDDVSSLVIPTNGWYSVVSLTGDPAPTLSLGEIPSAKTFLDAIGAASTNDLAAHTNLTAEHIDWTDSSSPFKTTTAGGETPIADFNVANSSSNSAIRFGNPGYGWYWFYEGSGSGNDNLLKLYSERLTDTLVYSIWQDGTVQWEGSLFAPNAVFSGTSSLLNKGAMDGLYAPVSITNDVLALVSDAAQVNSRVVACTNYSITYSGGATNVDGAIWLLAQTTAWSAATGRVEFASTDGSYIVDVDVDLKKAIYSGTTPLLSVDSAVSRLSDTSIVYTAWCNDAGCGDYYAYLTNAIPRTYDLAGMTPNSVTNDGAGIIQNADDLPDGWEALDDGRLVVNAQSLYDYVAEMVEVAASQWGNYTASGARVLNAEVVTIDEPLIQQGGMTWLQSGDYICQSYMGGDWWQTVEGSAWWMGPSGSKAYGITSTNKLLNISSFVADLAASVVTLDIETNGVAATPEVLWTPSLGSSESPAQWLSCPEQTMTNMGTYWRGQCALSGSKGFYRVVSAGGENRFVCKYIITLEQGFDDGDGNILTLQTNTINGTSYQFYGRAL